MTSRPNCIYSECSSEDPSNLSRFHLKNYLQLIFKDLCSKDNGLLAQNIDLYTFTKVTLYSVLRECILVLKTARAAQQKNLLPYA